MKVLKGLTHVIFITATSSKDADKTGIYAQAELCFGSDDEAVKVFYVKLKNGKMGWRLPFYDVYEDGKKITLPAFKGPKLEGDLTKFAGGALDRLKKDLGSFKSGKRYRVSSAGAVLEETKKSAA